MRTVILLAGVAVTLTACANAKVEPAETNPTDMPAGPGLFSGKTGNILSAFQDKPGGPGATNTLGVNSYLWRASLESVAFMPITQADSTGGVITTDWYANPGKPNERVKANILILGKVLRADALKVTLFKQAKTKDGWTDTAVDAATTRQLEDVILTKARALRVAAQANN